jgi:hypothetical protein
VPQKSSENLNGRLIAILCGLAIAFLVFFGVRNLREAILLRSDSLSNPGAVSHDTVLQTIQFYGMGIVAFTLISPFATVMCFAIRRRRCCCCAGSNLKTENSTGRENVVLRSARTTLKLGIPATEATDGRKSVRLAAILW